MDWQRVRDLGQKEVTLRTKQGQPFQILDISEQTIKIEVSTGQQHTISRTNLEQAVEYLQRGGSIAGPGQYKKKIADDRPSYAWAILLEMGYLDS